MSALAGDMPLKAKDVAEALGLHVNTVKRLDPAELPYFRVTSRGDRRYSALDVQRYIDRRRVR